MLTQKAIVLSASQYRVTDDRTGEVNEGCTVRYLMADNLNPHEEEAKPVKGRVPAKANMPYDYYGKIPVLPALYEVVCDFSVDSKGKAAITPTQFNFVNGVKVTFDSVDALSESGSSEITPEGKTVKLKLGS